MCLESHLRAGSYFAPSNARQAHTHVLVLLLLVTEIGVSLLKYCFEAKERSPKDRPSLHLPRAVYFSVPLQSPRNIVHTNAGGNNG